MNILFLKRIVPEREQRMVMPELMRKVDNRTLTYTPTHCDHYQVDKYNNEHAMIIKNGTKNSAIVIPAVEVKRSISNRKNNASIVNIVRRRS